MIKIPTLLLLIAAFAFALETSPRGPRHDEELGVSTSDTFFGLRPYRPTMVHKQNTPSMIAPINLYIVWYGLGWTSSDKAIVTDFLSGIDSSTFWSVATKYYQQYNNGPIQNVTNKVTIAGQVDDAYSLGKSLNYYGSPNNYQDFRVIIDSHRNAGAFPTDLDGMYLVLTDQYTIEYGLCNSYCAFHDSFASFGNPNLPNLVYGFIGNPAACGLNGIYNCGGQNPSPNSNAGVDTMLSMIIHEIAEASSNPLVATSGWNNAVSDNTNFGAGENADDCAYIYGSNRTYDEVNNYHYNYGWNGRKYHFQQLWDPNTQYCGPAPNLAANDCAKFSTFFQNVNSTYIAGSDCCNSGWVDCANGFIDVIDVRSSNQLGDLETYMSTIYNQFPHITQLYLGSNSFTGSFAVNSNLCKFSNLKYISISFLPQLTGSLPSCLSTLKNLQWISMHDTGLSGAIPDVFGAMKNLYWVNLAMNRHTGNVPVSLSSAPSLTGLLLQGNAGMGGVIPNGFKAFGGLTTGPLLGNFPAQTYCNMTGTSLTLPALSIYTGPGCAIDSYDVRSKSLTGDFETYVASVYASNPNILQLYLGSNNFIGSISANSNLCKFAYLTYLSVSYLPNVSGQLPACLANLVNMQWLSMHDSGFSGPIPDIFANMKSLYWVNLSANKHTGAIPPSLVSNPTLTNFFLQQNPGLSGVMPSGWPAFAGQTVLPVIGQYPGPTSCNMTGTGYTLPAPSTGYVGPSCGLDGWNVDGSRLSGDFETYIGQVFTKCPACKYLFLSNNAFTGTLAANSNLCKFTYLVTLDANNIPSLGGLIPSCLGNLAHLDWLSMSNTKLSGSIPDVWQSSTVRAIFIVNATLTGNVPASLTADGNLSQLYLNGNNGMSGVIPAGFTRLQYYCDLSGTSLALPCGVYPGNALCNLNTCSIVGTSKTTSTTTTTKAVSSIKITTTTTFTATGQVDTATTTSSANPLCGTVGTACTIPNANFAWTCCSGTLREMADRPERPGSAGGGGLAGFLVTELGSLISEAKKKNPDVKDAAELLLALVKSLQPPPGMRSSPTANANDTIAK
ncbi:UNVERIFIED_CONTAM: hypothetical protein HDU68_004386, partial [Siphonaria sp. JEL0065]